MTNEIGPKRNWSRRAIDRWKAVGQTVWGAIQKVPTLLQRYYLWLVIPTALAVYGVTSAFITWDVFWTVDQTLEDLGRATEADEKRSYAYTLGALLTALVVLSTLPIALIKTWINERSTRNAEQGHITDRLNAAIRMLGEEKTRKFRVRTITYDLPTGDDRVPVETNQIAGQDPDPPIHSDAENLAYSTYETSERTEPNLEVRLGAIYALERIAQDSDRDHITVMEVLCAYIRENAKARDAEPLDLGDWPKWPKDADEGAREAYDAEVASTRKDLREQIETIDAPRVDIQAALTVIGRRNADQIDIERRAAFELDLRNTNLRKVDLRKANLNKALLIGAQMEGAYLMEAQMQGANLAGARMQRAYLDGAQMQGANLAGARMQRAYLDGAQMQGADLFGAQMEGADLFGAQMEGANLEWAQMQGANLREAQMQAANLAGARMQRAYLDGAQMQGADLFGAQMQAANLAGAQMQGANVREAQMEGANLFGAQMQGAKLGGAQMQGAKLGGASLKSADLSRWTIVRATLRSADLIESKNLTQDSVNTAFGDAATILPDGIRPPDHWDEEINVPVFDDPKYEAWIAAGAPPGKPKRGA